MPTLSTFKPTRLRATRSTRPGVPWGTVATFAVGLSGTAAFWLVSLAGAVGAPERSETPFATWVMLSVVLLPVYGVAVLAALMLAKRWFGPVLSGWARVLATALLVLAGGTLTGVAAIAASGVYDYNLQMHVLHTMGGMDGMASCTGPCIPREEHQILALHVHGVQLVGERLLLTNAVLVAWIVAMWGGRIKLTNRSWRDHGTVEDSSAEGSLANDARLLLVGTFAGAGVINAASVLGEPVAGWRLLALAAVELVVAALLLARFHERAVLLAAGALSAVGAAVWLWTHTLGAESVDLAGVLVCFLEVGALIAVLALLEPGRPARPALSAHTKALVALSLIGLISVGFTATGPSWFDAFGVHSIESSMGMSE